MRAIRARVQDETRQAGENAKRPAAAGEARRTSGLRFECTMCGKCCSRRGKYAHVYLTDEEITALARLRETSERAFRKAYTFEDELGWTQIRFDDEYCPFLNRATNACTVYEARPVQCRTFPFWADMVGKNGWTAEAREICEGVGHGAVQPVAKVEASICEMQEADDH
jgi:Fe-S-cluster containining protein